MMRSFLASILVCSAVLDCACSTPVLDERTACNQDNLLNALVHHIPDSYQFCSAYISVPAISTVTAYTATCILSSYVQVSTIIHPLNLFNIQPQPYSISATPLSYNSASPTPITIPGGPQGYLPPQKVRRGMGDGSPVEIPSEPEPEVTAAPSVPRELLRRATPTLPSYLSTTYPPSRISSGCSCLSVPAASTTTISANSFSIDFTTTCTSYIPTTVANYPAFCAPSLLVNAPQPAAHASYAVVPTFPVASKLDCCAACASVFNCAWWKFTYGTPGSGWSPGTCHYAYFTGKQGDADMAGFGQPAVCPNGVTRGILNPDLSHIGENENVNRPGYNPGMCGGGFNNFESAQDQGYPDYYWLHTCGGSNGDPTTNPPGCD